MYLAIPRDASSGRRWWGVWLRSLRITSYWVGLTVFFPRRYFLMVSWHRGLHIRAGKRLYSFARWWHCYQKTWAP